MKNTSVKFIFITGGVVSSLGKGLASASLGAILQARGFKVKLRKLDPYLNVDPGTMSPYHMAAHINLAKNQHDMLLCVTFSSYRPTFVVAHMFIKVNKFLLISTQSPERIRTKPPDIK